MSLKNSTYLLLIILGAVSTQNAMQTGFSENYPDEGYVVFEDDDLEPIRFEGYVGEWKNEYGENVPHVEGEDLARVRRDYYQAQIDRLESVLADYTTQDIENFVRMLEYTPEIILPEDQSYERYLYLRDMLREQCKLLDELERPEEVQACEVIMQYVDLLDFKKHLKDLNWWILQEQVLRYADNPPSYEEHMERYGERRVGQRLDVAAERDAALAVLGLTYDARLINKSLIQQQADMLKGQVRARYLAERNRSFAGLSELVGKKRDEYIRNIVFVNPDSKALWDRLYQEEQEAKNKIDQATQILIAKYFSN